MQSAERISGMTSSPMTAKVAYDTSVQSVFELLNRNLADYNPISLIARGFGPEQIIDTGIEREKIRAIGFDTNALFRIASNKKSAAIIDGLEASRLPLVVPGQVLQEFWNNKVTGLPTLSGTVASGLDKIEKELESMTDTFGLGEALSEVTTALNKFTKTHKGLVSSSLTASLRSLFEMLDARSTIAYVPRQEFAVLGQARFSTKTPPGFKDSNSLGDFFVWADFLLGLCTAGLDQMPSGTTDGKDIVIFVTEDRKVDWEVRGYVHPVLEGEVERLTGSALQLWTVSELLSFLEA